MTISFKNAEEYLDLDPRIKSMYESGFDKFPLAYESFGGTNSVFKFDLGNDDPFEINPNFSTQNRSSKSVELGNGV